MAGTAGNEKVEPVYVTFGEDIMQLETVTAVADVAASLNNKYFVWYTTGGTKHYIWYNVASGGSDPVVSGGTAHEVDIASGATATAIATATAAVLTAVTGFDSTSDGATFTILATAAGYAKPAHDGAGPTAFAFEVNYYGDTALDLGYCDGDISWKKEVSYAPVNSHQTGTNILSEIETGRIMSLTLSLKETAVSQLRKVISTGEGDSMIPDGTGVSGTEVLGEGTSRQFKQTFGRSRKLMLHPVVLPTSNMSRNLTFWKAFPKINEIVFSGENILMIPVDFSVYPDFTKQDKVQFYAYGDATQTLT